MLLPPDYEIVHDPDYVWQKGDIYGSVKGGDYEWEDYINGLAGTTSRRENKIFNKAAAVARNTKKVVYDNSSYVMWGETHYNKYLNETMEVVVNKNGKVTFPPKKAKEVTAPAGYSLITDDNYIIKSSDLYYLGMWASNRFETVDYLSSYIGRTFGQANEKFGEKSYNGFYIASKSPRFKTDKPYPWGY